MDPRPLTWFRHLRRDAPRATKPRGLGPIGLDFGTERLNLLQMERRGGGLHIRAAHSLPYPEPRDTLLESPRRLRAFLREARNTKPFRGRRVITHMPSGSVKLLHLGYEPTAGQADEVAIVKAAQERLGSNLGGWIVDFLPIRGDEGPRGERTSLVVAAKRDVVIRHLEVLRRCGLRVEALEVGPVAIRRLIASLSQSDARYNSLVINFARHKTYLSVIWGRRLAMNRELDFGEDRLLSRLSEHLEVSTAEAAELVREYGVFQPPRDEWELPESQEARAVSQSIMEIVRPSFAGLVEEVNKALIYVSSLTRGGSVQQVYLLGGVARWPRASALVHTLLQLPVEVPNPFAAFQTADPAAAATGGTPIAGLALATGYALRGMLDDG